MHSILRSLVRNSPVALSIIVIGSIWGLAEATLGGFLHTIHFTGTGAVMGSIAIALMTIFITASRKPLLVPLLGVIAASFKPFSALIFGQPVFSAYVVNPATAIIMEAVAFAIVATIFQRLMERRLAAKIGTGFLAGFSGLALYTLVASIFGMGKWATLSFGGRIDAVIDSGLPIAITGAVALTISYYIGKYGAPRFASFRTLHPGFYYSGLSALVVCCWAIPPVFQLG
jgi:hypothetical protein